MATRSMIAIQNEDKTITAVYCHFDGYLEGVGKNLLTYFRNINDVEELISQGDMACLGKNSKKLNNNNPEGTEFYNNDTLITFTNTRNFLKKYTNSNIEYLYLFKKNEWLYVKCYSPNNKFSKISLDN